MKDLVYLSRSFVEFGPFTKKEILDFHDRHLLTGSDYLCDEGSENWLHYQEWLNAAPKAAPAPAAKEEKKPAAPKASKPKAEPAAKVAPETKPAPAPKKGKKAA